MVLFYGGDWDDGHVSCMHNSGESSSSLEQEIEPLLSYYPDISIVNCTSIGAFKEECWGLYHGLAEGRGCPYQAFLGVSAGMLEAIESLRERNNLPQMCILYDKVEEIVIAKIMVGVAHDTCAEYFGDRLKEMFGSRIRHGFLASNGSGRRGLTARRAKEPDISFTPKSRDPLSDWPSIVVEVGHSESLRYLQGDLKYWLTNTNGMTRVAILLHINSTNETILVERWEVVPRVRPARATGNYGPTVRRVQSILLNAHVVYTGQSLSIPADQVFDNIPLIVGPGQFTLSAQDLDSFNNEYWAWLGVVPLR